VFILSDDQRADTLYAMPNVQRLLGAHGVTFTHFYATTPVCCPSRSSFLTGQYSHHTGVLDNVGPDGGAKAFDDRSTVATWLHDAGYTTGLFGKYLNGYPELDKCRVPPGWSTWNALDAEPLNTYYGFTLNRDGRLVTYPDDPAHYETDVLTGLADDFIRTAPEPFFAYIAPSNPHRPAEAAPPDEHSYRGIAPYDSPSYDEADLDDKPWHERIAPMSEIEKTTIQRVRRHMLESLRSLDRDVGRIMRAIEARGALDNTVVVFASDNGFLWGEHRLLSKTWPYEESIKVPLVIRTPWTDRAVIDDRLTGNIDLASTFTELAGTSPGLPQDGRSLVPLLRGRDTPWRSDLLIEWQGRNVAAHDGPLRYLALHTSRYIYIVYDNDRHELYDLERDPYQLTNIINDPDQQALRDRLRARLRLLFRESCDRAPCSSPSPGENGSPAPPGE
jgi:arylsulfatase A-like enzyme